MVKKRKVRKKKRARMTRGPKFYTICVLKKFMELSNSPVERARYARMLNLLKADEIKKFEKMPGSMGLVNSEALAMVKLEAFLDSKLEWLDAETRAKGKSAYSKKVRKAFSSLAKELNYQGKYEALVSHLIGKAARMYSW